MKSINKNKLFIRILTLVSFLLMIFVFLPLLEFITMFNGMGFDHPTLFMNIVSTSFLLLHLVLIILVYYLFINSFIKYLKRKL